MRGEAYLLAACAIWGLTFPLMKYALDYIDPYLFLFYRFGMAVLVLAPIALKRVRREALIPGIITGTTLFLGYLFQIVGLKYTLSTNSGLITSLYVVFAPVFSYIMYRERVRRAEYAALGTAFLGLLLLSGPGGETGVGDFITFLSAVAYGVQVALVYRYSRMHDPLGFTFVQICVVFALALPAPFLYSFPPPEASVVLPLLYTSLAGTAFALVLQVVGQRKTSTPRASTIYTSEAAFAMLFSFLLLGETLTPMGYAGAALIISSILAAAGGGREG